MNQTEKPKVRTGSANTTERDESDAPTLFGPTGREVPSSAGGRPRSEATGRHDAGSGANETTDGLTSSEEELRRGAEEVPVGAPEKKLEDIPVFDRADALPKV
jgi:hypothetical protein